MFLDGMGVIFAFRGPGGIKGGPWLARWSCSIDIKITIFGGAWVGEDICINVGGFVVEPDEVTDPRFALASEYMSGSDALGTL